MKGTGFRWDRCDHLGDGAFADHTIGADDQLSHVGTPGIRNEARIRQIWSLQRGAAGVRFRCERPLEAERLCGGRRRLTAIQKGCFTHPDTYDRSRSGNDTGDAIWCHSDDGRRAILRSRLWVIVAAATTATGNKNGQQERQQASQE